MSRPLVAVACAFAVGTAVGGGLPLRAAVELMALSATALVAVTVGLAPAAGRGLRRAGVLAAALAVGAAAAGIEGRQYDAAPLRVWILGQPDAGPVKVLGVCQADARDASGKWVLVLDVEDVSGQPMAGRARIDVGGMAGRPELIEGDRVSLWAELRVPRGLSDPGAFDAAAQARRDGIHPVGWSKSPRLVQATGERAAGWLSDRAARARRWARARLAAPLPPRRGQALVRAMALGGQSALGTETSA